MKATSSCANFLKCGKVFKRTNPVKYVAIYENTAPVRLSILFEHGLS